jgi:succinate dehydrogenase / fumarate reductase cytochrome b subunit
MRRLADTLASSIGRKVVLGLTGLLLVGFSAVHLFGNLNLVPPFGEADGSSFVEYRDALHSIGVYLIVAEVGLLALFLCHVYLAFRLTLENWEARKQRYAVRADCGAQTFASATMFYTGALVLGFLIKHVIDFRFDADYQADPFGVLARTLASPLHGTLYVLAMIALGVHLSHGFQSAFQTLGLTHPAYRTPLRILGYAVAVALAAGFAMISLYFLVVWTEEGAS